MSYRDWTTLTRAASIAGLATYAVAIVLAPAGSEIEAFFNAWFYNGLMVLACVVVGSRALLVPRERPAWIAFTAALASWTFAEVWYAAVHPVAYQSVADVGYLGFYPLVYVGIVVLVRARARPIGGTLWLDGLTASLAATALGAAVLLELVLESTEGSVSTVATNLAYPLGDLLLLSAVFGVFSLAPGALGNVGCCSVSACSRLRSLIRSSFFRAPRRRTWRDRGSTSSGRPHCS